MDVVLRLILWHGGQNIIRVASLSGTRSSFLTELITDQSYESEIYQFFRKDFDRRSIISFFHTMTSVLCIDFNSRNKLLYRVSARDVQR